MRIHGAALRVIRERTGLTESALAKAAGISQSHLANLESGRRNAGPKVITDLAHALRVDVSAIVQDQVGAA